jgi:mersacidin/lichenicidin family type 2 lantibiotic
VKKKQIIEAWRNEEYYLSLTEDERAALPKHPSGPAGMEAEALKSVTGGCGSWPPPTSGYCTPCPPLYCY